jgi:hypothetical protein
LCCLVFLVHSITIIGIAPPKLTDGTSVIEVKRGSDPVQVRLSKSYRRNVAHLGMTGDLYFQSSHAVVFKDRNKFWKYTFFPNALAVFSQYETAQLNCIHLFNLSDDPEETTNLATNPTFTKVLQAGMDVIDSIEGVPSPLDLAGGAFLRNINGVSPKGCWIPPDHPAYLTANCGYTLGVDIRPFLSPTGVPLPSTFAIRMATVPVLPPQC